MMGSVCVGFVVVVQINGRCVVGMCVVSKSVESRKECWVDVGVQGMDLCMGSVV